MPSLSSSYTDHRLLWKMWQAAQPTPPISTPLSLLLGYYWMRRGGCCSLALSVRSCLLLLPQKPRNTHLYRARKRYLGLISFCLFLPSEPPCFSLTLPNNGRRRRWKGISQVVVFGEEKGKEERKELRQESLGTGYLKAIAHFVPLTTSNFACGVFSVAR